MSETPRGHTNDACCSCCYEVNRLQRENTELRAENANLRESAETATFVANNMSESWRTEVERREDAQLHGDAARAEVDRLRKVATFALEELDDMIGYVPEFFQEKWGFPESIEKIRAALDGQASDETLADCECDYDGTHAGWCADDRKRRGPASNEE